MNEEWILDPEKLRLVVLPGSNSPSQILDSRSVQAYAYYKKTWQRIMTRLDGEHGFRSEGFALSHYVSTVFHEEDVTSQICHRVIDIGHDACLDLEYFQDFKGAALDRMKAGGRRRYMTLEWSSVDPKYSRRRSGLPFAEITMHLSIQLGRELGVDGCIGVPRRLTGVQDVSSAMGFIAMETQLMRYGCPVDIMMAYMPEFVPHYEPKVQALIEKLWKERVDFRSNVETLTPGPRVDTIGVESQI